MDKRHLDRYLADFDFRRNTRVKFSIDDVQRTTNAVKGIMAYRRKIHGRKP